MGRTLFEGGVAKILQWIGPVQAGNKTLWGQYGVGGNHRDSKAGPIQFQTVTLGMSINGLYLSFPVRRAEGS